MPWTEVPGTNTRMRPASETMADEDYEVYTDAQGHMHARKKPGPFTKSLPYVIGAGMGVGALMNAGVIGGMAAAGGGSGAAGPFTTINAAGLPVTPGLAGAGAPFAPAAAGIGAAAAQSKGFTGSILNWLKDPKNLIGLGGAVPLAMQAFGGAGGGGGTSATEEALLAEIRQNLGLQRARFQAAQPAFETAQRMAIGMAPVQYRAGGA